MLFPLFFLITSFTSGPPTVIVTVPPQKGLLERIAGDSVKTAILVPPGASPHSFEPTPKELLSLTSGKVWFRIGEPFEEKAIRMLAKTCHIVDMRKDLSLLHSSCSCHRGEDLHYWLSPKLLQLQAESMATTLCEAFPENSALYRANLEKVQEELTLLDSRIRELLKGKEGRYFVVAHAAYGYFCQEYGLIQLSIEENGKEPTPKALVNLIEKAKNTPIVFAIEPYSPKGITLIAKEIGAEVNTINPYAEDPIANLESLAQTLHDSL